MPGYINNVLNKFQHDSPKTPHHTPSKYVTPVYGAKMQYATQDDPSSLTNSAPPSKKSLAPPYTTLRMLIQQ
jgi:hypothetical protein